MEVYLDYGATSYRKPESVFENLSNFYHLNNSNPGRGGYRLALEAGQMLLETRKLAMTFFGCSQEDQVVFTKNVTEALNLSIMGLSTKGDHWLISSIEHNSVYRVVEHLRAQGEITYDIVSLDREGNFDLEAFKAQIKPETKGFIFNHVSNVSGHILPLDSIVKICQSKGILTIVDGAQSAGLLPYNHQLSKVDVFCFTGHKHLMGPMGTGGLIVNEVMGKRIKPLIYGGTGSLSEKSSMPDFLPDRFEAGTLNALGIAALKGAFEYLSQQDLEENFYREKALSNFLVKGLMDCVPGIRFYGNLELPRIPLFSFNIKDVDNGSLAFHLDDEYNIMSRSGLHCSPLAHKTFNDLTGSIRFSLGHYTTEEEVDYVLDVFKKLF